jgi:hypothetical protein
LGEAAGAENKRLDWESQARSQTDLPPGIELRN